MHEKIKIIALLILATGITFILRLLTLFLLSSGDIPQVLTPDPWYIIRQIDLASHIPCAYTWFDPFTSYPDGGFIHWGPFLPILGSLFTLWTKSTELSAMISWVSWIPVIIAILTVPFVFYYGRNLQGDVGGIVAAFLIAVIPGSYLIRSLYGYVDHHILESFFMLLYACGFSLFTKKIIIKDSPSSQQRTALIGGIVTGLILGLGMINAPTMICAAGISTICMLVMGYHLLRSHTDMKPLIYYTICVSSTGALITFGGLHPDPASPVPIFFNPVFLAGSLLLPALCAIFLGILQTLWREKNLPETWIIPAIAGTGIGVYLLGRVLVPGAINSIQRDIVGIASPASSSFAIAEYLPLSPDIAFFNYHIMLILLFPGLLLLLHEWIRNKSPFALYLMIWTTITSILTIVNTRYEILFAIPLTITSAYAISRLFYYEKKNPDPSETKETIWQNRPTALIALILLIGTFGLSLCISMMVATADYNYQPYIASEDWVEGLLWMKNATPDPGVDYYQTYHADSFRYPDAAYGVLSWWDYGHWITTIAHRMAVTNPFQAHVDMAAQFFMSREEKTADKISTDNDIRYIITDADMLFDTMQMMIRVYSPEATPGQYMGLLSVNDSTGKPVTAIGYRQLFYESMVTRLHVFDGTGVNGERRKLGQEGTPIPGTDMRVIFPGDPDPEISGSIIRPLQDIEALQHYRLIWESNTSLSTTNEHDIRKVKIFERVPGAKIQGEGTIELPMITNRGRIFTYRQNSNNGTFILPYSTNRTAWPVHATGPYRMLETGEEIEVSEESVQGN